MNIKLLAALIVGSVVSTSAFSFDAKFAGSEWNSSMVPKGQQCQKFGGNNPATPKLIVSGVPNNADKIILEYSDRDSKRMNNGGHGQMSYMLKSSASEVEIQSVMGHTFDIPKSFNMIEAHRGPGWDKAGAYMPPCSGGKGHEYYVTIKAVKGGNVIATTVLEMGKY